MTIRRVPCDPYPTRHRSDVSDPQSVASHPDRDERALLDSPAKDKPVPYTVIDAEPVPARLPSRIRLILSRSTDQAWLMLPVRDPTVITTRRELNAPWPTLHRTDVSDSQPVASHPVCPVRPLAVGRTRPSPAPCTVTDAEPVPARLDRLEMLKLAVSIDHAWLILPPCPPTVIINRRDALLAYPARHLTDVSDSQLVPSHPVCPVRPLAVCRTDPMLLPCTVKDAEPVPARFVRRVRLMVSESADQP